MAGLPDIGIIACWSCQQVAEEVSPKGSEPWAAVL